MGPYIEKNITIAIFIWVLSRMAVADILHNDNHTKNVESIYKYTVISLDRGQFHSYINNSDSGSNEQQNDGSSYEEKSSTALFSYLETTTTDTPLLDTQRLFANTTDTDRVCDVEHPGHAEFRHCYDDRECRVYGDCCRNGPYYDEHEQTARNGAANAGEVYNNTRYGCYDVRGLGRCKMIGRCPRNAGREISAKCARIANGSPASEYPVTGSVTGHLYRNVYCALCHGEPQGVLYWKPNVTCLYGQNGTFDRADSACRAHCPATWYRDQPPDQSTRSDVEGRNMFGLIGCEESLLRPPGDDVPKLRDCDAGVDDAGVVDGCPADAPDGLARACASRSYTVFEYKRDKCNSSTGPGVPRTFRNVECALCNDVTTDFLNCLPPFSNRGTPDGSLSVLFESPSDYSDLCAPNELYDATADRCRDEFCEFSSACRKYDGALTYPYLASVLGSSVSVVALVAHLALFFADAKPKSLHEKSLFSLAASLLLGYGSYLANDLQGLVGPSSGGLCLAYALAMYLGFTAAFAWMLVMSVDVWTMLHASSRNLRIVRGRRNGRFVAYSAFAWLVPAALTAFAAFLQTADVPAFSGLRPDIRPGSRHKCWFRNPRSLIVLFVSPVGAIIVANCAAFVGSVRVISASGKWLKSAGAATSSAAAFGRYRKDFKLYTRLSTTTGLAWMFGLVGVVTEHDVVWAVFNTINPLQGAFIFIFFDCDWDKIGATILPDKLASVIKTPTTSDKSLSTSNHCKGVTTG